MAKEWPGIVDTHAHLDFRHFDKDRDDVIARARKCGLNYIINVGSDLDSCHRTVGLVQANHNFIYGAVGIHPHNAVTVDGEVLSALRKLAQSEGIMAIGEIGLDYHYNHSPRAIQKRVFKTQLRLARTLKKPVIIHSREADEDVMNILDAEAAGELGGVLHCFSGSYEMAATALRLGFHLSFGGILTFPKAQSTREVVATVPLERLLVETDAPYLTPVPFRGRRNEPAYIGHVANKLAAIRNLPVAEVIKVTSANACRLFGIST